MLSSSSADGALSDAQFGLQPRGTVDAIFSLHAFIIKIFVHQQDVFLPRTESLAMPEAVPRAGVSEALKV